MKMLFLALATITVMAAIGCQKKDDGAPAGAPGCPPGHLASPAWGGQCLTQAQCPVGHVQKPDQPSMCMHFQTGVVSGPQQCGSGYVLTANGCAPQCPGQPGKGLVANACIDAVSGYSNNYNNYNYGGTYGNGYYGNGYYQPYGYNPYYYPRY